MDPDRKPLDVEPAAAGPQSAAEPAGPDADATASAQRASTEPPSAGSDPDAPLGSGSAGADTKSDVEALNPLEADAVAPSPADTLSPAVRRLVRQYDLDVTGIHGTGPSGKIRVADVIGILGGRAEASPRASDARAGATPLRDAEAPAPTAASAAPTTSVFECDLSRVLSHRKRERRSEAELLLTGYFLSACAEALRAVPEIVAPERPGAPCFGVLISAADGSVRRTVVGPVNALDARLRAFDRQLRAEADDDLDAAQLLIHHHGASGSLLATATELGRGHAASVGIGRVRKQIVLKNNVDGEETPRVTALCYVTLTFRPDRVALHRANRFLSELVRVIEQWPADAAT